MTTELNFTFYFIVKGSLRLVATVVGGAAGPESGQEPADVSVAHHSSQSLQTVYFHRGASPGGPWTACIRITRSLLWFLSSRAP